MKQLSNIINTAITDKIFSAIAIEVAKKGTTIFSRYTGTTNFDENKERIEDITDQHLFDLASLTKPLCTAMLCNVLIDKKLLSLNTSVADIFDQYALNFNKTLASVTIGSLLNHSSGLEAWMPLYNVVKSRGDAYMFIRSRALDHETGTKHVYSDLGYIMLGEIIEIIMEKRLDHLFELYVSEIMDIHNIRFIPKGTDVDDDKFVCSGYSELRNKHLFGEVNDENCFVLGGVAGHAGLFGTAKDVCAIAEHIRTCINGSANRPIISKDSSTKMLEKSSIDPDWAYGWHYPSVGKSSAGQHISTHSIGMTGFTGTSVWIDLDRDLVITILANRTVSPDSAKFGWEMDRFTELRPKLHDAILGEIGQ